MIQPAIVAATAVGNASAEALTHVGASFFLRNIIEHPLGHWVDFLVLVVLGVMSLWSWCLIIVISVRNTQIRARVGRVVKKFWDTPSAQDAIHAMERQPRSEPFSKIALEAVTAAAHHQRHEGSPMVEALNRSEFVDRALRQAVDRESRNLEGGLTVLATVGSAAVFVGLLGTVMGIYNALIALGSSGQSSISAVAGPVGECLIMTAMGLAAAIPAVIAYNAFTRSNRVTIAQFDEFAHDLHDFFATGSRVEGGPGRIAPGTAAAAVAPATEA